MNIQFFSHFPFAFLLCVLGEKNVDDASQYVRKENVCDFGGVLLLKSRWKIDVLEIPKRFDTMKRIFFEDSFDWILRFINGVERIDDKRWKFFHLQPHKVTKFTSLWIFYSRIWQRWMETVTCWKVYAGVIYLCRYEKAIEINSLQH